AKQHLDALNIEIARYIKEDPYGVSHKQQGNYHEAEAIITKEPLPNLGCIIGDCITNIRASLDYIAWEIGIKCLPKVWDERRWRKIAFPITFPTGRFNDDKSTTFLRDI